MHDRTFTRLLAVSALALAAACSNEGASSSESAAPADTGLEGEAPADGGEMAASKEKLKTMRAQFAVVDMDADTSFLTEEERQELPAQVVLSREELRILEDFVRRRRRLSPERAEELAELCAPALAERTGIVAPTAERTLVLAFARATGRDR